MLGIGTDRRADIQHDRLATRGRPKRRQRRPINAGQRVQTELRHRHQRAGVARGDSGVRLTALHRVEGAPHGRDPSSGAQRDTRLVVHADRDIRVPDLRSVPQLRMRGQQIVDLPAVAEKQEPCRGPALARDRSPFDHDSRAVIAAHRIKGDPHDLWHQCQNSRYEGRGP